MTGTVADRCVAWCDPECSRRFVDNPWRRFAAACLSLQTQYEPSSAEKIGDKNNKICNSNKSNQDTPVAYSSTKKVQFYADFCAVVK